MKQLTKTAVTYSALLLIEAHEETTTLDVKMQLRQLGFRADQDDVSDFMMEVQDDLHLGMEDNGQYRTYTMPELDDIASDPVSGTAAKSGSISTVNQISEVYVKRNGDRVFAFDNSDMVTGVHSTDGSQNHWQVRSYENQGNNGNPLYFHTDYSRDEVRQAYAHIKGVPFADTRTVHQP
tara:strand:+ start:96 stop:632 length:537 start_codon:yes stop_codon:yes gene_type:complete